MKLVISDMTFMMHFIVSLSYVSSMCDFLGHHHLKLWVQCLSFGINIIRVVESSFTDESK